MGVSDQAHHAHATRHCVVQDGPQRVVQDSPSVDTWIRHAPYRQEACCCCSSSDGKAEAAPPRHQGVSLRLSLSLSLRVLSGLGCSFFQAFCHEFPEVPGCNERVEDEVAFLKAFLSFLACVQGRVAARSCRIDLAPRSSLDAEDPRDSHQAR